MRIEIVLILPFWPMGLLFLLLALLHWLVLPVQCLIQVVRVDILALLLILGGKQDIYTKLNYMLSRKTNLNKFLKTHKNQKKKMKSCRVCPLNTMELRRNRYQYYTTSHKMQETWNCIHLFYLSFMLQLLYVLHIHMS